MALDLEFRYRSVREWTHHRKGGESEGMFLQYMQIPELTQGRDRGTVSLEYSLYRKEEMITICRLSSMLDSAEALTDTASRAVRTVGTSKFRQIHC